MGTLAHSQYNVRQAGIYKNELSEWVAGRSDAAGKRSMVSFAVVLAEVGSIYLALLFFA